MPRRRGETKQLPAARPGRREGSGGVGAAVSPGCHGHTLVALKVCPLVARARGHLRRVGLPPTRPNPVSASLTASAWCTVMPSREVARGGHIGGHPREIPPALKDGEDLVPVTAQGSPRQTSPSRAHGATGLLGVRGPLRTTPAVCAWLRRVLGAERVPAVPGQALCCRAPCKRLVNKVDICPGQGLPSPTSLPHGQPAEPPAHRTAQEWDAGLPEEVGSCLWRGATSNAHFCPKPSARILPLPRAQPPV